MYFIDFLSDKEYALSAEGIFGAAIPCRIQPALRGNAKSEEKK